MHAVRIGTCGWSYDDWKGVFYPPGTKPADYLQFYAQQFSTVEVDSTFYRSPSRKTVEGWNTKTPPDFRFSLKVPQVITHDKVLLDCQKEVDTFLDAARLLGPKLLCCVLQFGYFNQAAFASVRQFLDRLDSFLAIWPRDFPIAVEVRNKNWLQPALAECLRTHHACWVLTDQAWMPTPLALSQKLDVVTGPRAYLRLLGDRSAVDQLTPTLDRTVIDRGDQIRADAEAIRGLRDRVEVLAYVNNHFAGYAPATIQQLRAALE
jgi:uncharacterized protein YecE (DUF72 family)